MARTLLLCAAMLLLATAALGVSTATPDAPRKSLREADVTPAVQSGADDAGKKKKQPTSCGDNKEKADCLGLGAQEGECAWCKGDFMPPSCVGTKAAQWIPETVAKCKLPKKKHDDDDDDDALLQAAAVNKKHSGGSSGGGSWPSGGGDWPSGGGDWPSGGGSAGGQGCMSLKSKKKCLRGTDKEGCAWCNNSFLGASCVSESTVKFMPPFIADCKMGKGPRKGDSVAAS